MGGPTATGGKTLGRYELICEVAKGQLGPLWAARSTGSENAPVVLIRRVSTAAPTTPDEIDSLSEGAWWMLEIQDAGLAKGIDVVKTEGELGVVTEYSEGEVLRSLLRLASFKRKPIPVGVALRIGVDVLDALDQANSQAQPTSNGQTSFSSGGLIPDSVLVGRDGHSRLLDVGILGPATKVPPIARHPEMAAYAAPEQLDNPAKADLRANLYAVGVMLWEMLSGKRLFVGSTHQAVVEKVKTGGIARLDASRPVGGEAIASKVADVVAKALEADPDARYASPKEMAEALREAAEAATHEQVGTLIEDLAGNTLASRKKLVEKAKAAPALPKPALRANAPVHAKSNGGPVAVPQKPLAAPPRKQKATLIGLQPLDVKTPEPAKVEMPEPRPQLESLDSEELQSVSKVEAFPVAEAPTRPSSGEMEALLAKEKKAASPKPPEVAEDDPVHLKTQLFGSQAVDPAAAIAVAKAEEDDKRKSKKEADKPSPFGPNPFGLGPTPKPPEVSPKLPPIAFKAEAPGLAVDMVEEELAPESLDSSELDEDEDEAKAAAEKAEKPTEKKPDSAVAWVGPPPGVALDDDDEDVVPASNVPERTQKMRRMVGAGIGVFAGLILLALIWRNFGGKTEETPPEPAPKTEAKTEPPKTEPAKTEEPKTEAKTEPAKTEEPKTEAKTEEPKTEEPATTTKSTKTTTPKTTTAKTGTAKTTATTTTPKTTTAKTFTTTTKPKTGTTKPKYTPSGI